MSLTTGGAWSRPVEGLSADELLTELRRFAAERGGNGIEDPEDAWWYQACFGQLDARMKAGEGPQAWQASQLRRSSLGAFVARPAGQCAEQ